MSDIPVFTVERTRFPGPSNWYVRVEYPDGSTLHGEPWNSEYAASKALIYMRREWAMAKSGIKGNGDTCPLFPEHGAMNALSPIQGRAPMQWCPNAMHDGAGFSAPGIRNKTSRSFWPLHGFEESVEAYLARFGLPDLSELEVSLGDDT